MFSYEDRIRAVKLYIKLGKRLGVTIRQLGYPTKNSLIGWYREYEQGLDLQVGYTRSKFKYSAEQQQVGCFRGGGPASGCARTTHYVSAGGCCRGSIWAEVRGAHGQAELS